MAYAWVQDVPIGVDVYYEIIAGLGDQPPEGLIVHVAQVMDDGHLRYLDVWESEAACERFTDSACIRLSARLARHRSGLTASHRTAGAHRRCMGRYRRG